MTRRPLVFAFLALVAFFVPLLGSRLALAAGTVTPARTDLQESNGGWKIFLTIKLPKKPANPTQPFRFAFQPKVIYETFLDDAHGDQEQTRNVPQGNDVQPLNASVDVNFADMSGKVWDTTKFDFTIRRDNGFLAGEYSVTVKDADGNKIGQPFTLRLSGKNDVVDRRAIVMADPSKKKKESSASSGGGEKTADAPKSNDAASDSPAGAKTEEGGGDAKGTDGAAPPPPVEPKRGGCGCSVPTRDGSTSGLVAAVALAFVALRRRAAR